jgi:macrolide transport system ATP-binding/permease protein
VNTFIQDVRYGLRLLIKSPIFTAVAVLSLAIGIGVSTSFLSFIDKKLLSPLSEAVKDPDRLARIYVHQTQINYPISLFATHSDYLFYRDKNPAFSDMLAYASHRRYSVQSDKDAAYIRGIYVSGNYFTLLGVQPCQGRNIMPADDRQGNSKPVAVISYPFWNRFFKSDPSITGKEVQVNRISFTIIGVAPENFTDIGGILESNSSDIYIPLAMQIELEPKIKDMALELIGRLKPEANLAQAQAVMQARYNHRPANSIPLPYQQLIVSSANQIHPVVKKELLKILGLALLMIVIILWIPCANVSSLLLVRAIERRKEIAVRAALGSSRLRILRQLLTEALLLAAFAGAVGPLLATWMIHILSSRSDAIFAAYGSGLSLDKNVLCFTIVLSFSTSLVFGLIPAFHMMRIDLTSALRDQEKSKLKAFRFLGARNLLVITNIAGSIAVLVIAGLIVQHVEKSNRVELPVNPEALLMIPLHLDPIDYSSERARQFRVQLLARLKALPQINSASLTGINTYQRLYAVESKSMQADIFFTDDSYFKSVNTPIVRGRDFLASEFQSIGEGAIINETTAKLFWPGQEALGRRLQSGYPLQYPGSRLAWPSRKTEVAVVGVVKDSPLGPEGAISESPKPMVYLPLLETSNNEMWLYVRTTGNAKSMASSIRQTITDLEPGLPISNIQTLAEQIEISKKQERYGLMLLVALGLMALGLASMGLYAVVSYSVGRRTQEIGIRMALGAAYATVLRQLLREGLKLITVGLATGLFAAWAIARFLESTGNIPVKSSDPMMYAAACLLLIPVAVAACYLPARRAVRANPAATLKYE